MLYDIYGSNVHCNDDGEVIYLFQDATGDTIYATKLGCLNEMMILNKIKFVR